MISPITPALSFARYLKIFTLIWCQFDISTTQFSPIREVFFEVFFTRQMLLTYGCQHVLLTMYQTKQKPYVNYPIAVKRA